MMVRCLLAAAALIVVVNVSGCFVPAACCVGCTGLADPYGLTNEAREAPPEIAPAAPAK